MRTQLRTRASAVAVAILAGVVLALTATSGQAVAFFSGGLFLDVQVGSPARLVAGGAAVDVPVEITCNAQDTVFVEVTVTQRSGAGVAGGTRFTNVSCAGSGQQFLIRVPASPAGKPFRRGTAVVDAAVFGCLPTICGSETDSEVVSIRR